MTRKFIDCREFPSESNCTVTIMADSVDELVAAAAQHAVAVHKHEDTPELRQGLKGLVREGTPPEHMHHH
jgi:predicted small metal-binding protein